MTTAPSADPRQILASRFGFADFRPGQERVIEALLAGRSALAVFPTGSGKSLCYQLPSLLLDGVTVVVSPLIALMKDQIDALLLQGIDAARLDSSLGPDEVRDVGERLRAGSLKLLYVAPERFNNERFLAQLEETPISLFAVDEAHCISEWGHNFRPDYLKLAVRARELGAERVLALTATATPAVVGDICAGFGIAEGDAVVTGFYRPNLTLLTTPARASERDQLLIDRLRERPPGATIVYVTLQRTALRVASLLAAAGLPARPYHAGMSAEDRVEVQEWWTGGRRQHRRRHDRLRDGDRQGRRPLRLPPEPAEGARVVLPGDRPGGPRRGGRCLRGLRLSGRHPDPGELLLRRHADAGGRGRPARRGLRTRRGCAVRGVGVRALGPVRRPSARAADDPHVPRARGAAAPGNAVLCGLQLPPGDGLVRRRSRGLRCRPCRLPAPADRERQDRAHLDEPRSGGRRGRAGRGSRPDRGRPRLPRAAAADRAAGE